MSTVPDGGPEAPGSVDSTSPAAADLPAEADLPGDPGEEPAVALRAADEVVVVEVEATVEVTGFDGEDLPVESVDADDVAPAVEDGEPGLIATQLDVLDVEPTGDPRVDDALDRMRDLAGLPTADHVEIYEDVHRRLQGALTDLDPEA
jgi:hypothetical protein